MAQQPHDAWAEVYDLAYQEEFGDLYGYITDITMDAIRKIAGPTARIVDFGAGTGRLAIPLAVAGYQVTAVEPSQPMLDRIGGSEVGASIDCVHCSMQDFVASDSFDLALCVFTVVIYLLDEDSLNRAFSAAARSLTIGGRLLMDVPPRAAFASRQVKRPDLERKVTIAPLNGSLYCYEDYIVTDPDGHPRKYSDKFTIRYWHLNDVIDAAKANGFRLEESLTTEFAMTGSEYFVLQRIG